jgi:hypothetical protein
VTGVGQAPRLTLSPELGGFSGEEAGAGFLERMGGRRRDLVNVHGGPLWRMPYSLPRPCGCADPQRRDSEGEMQKLSPLYPNCRLLDFLTLRHYADSPQPLNLDYSGSYHL